MEALMHTTVFTFSEPQATGNAIHQYKNGGDFADLVIVVQAISHHATKLFSFDKNLQKSFPDYVVEKLSATSL
jgi:predicted nucleic-acid-binding protein